MFKANHVPINSIASQVLITPQVASLIFTLDFYHRRHPTTCMLKSVHIEMAHVFRQTTNGTIM